MPRDALSCDSSSGSTRRCCTGVPARRRAAGTKKLSSSESAGDLLEGRNQLELLLPNIDERTARPVLRAFTVERSSTSPLGIADRKLDCREGVVTPLRRRSSAYVRASAC